MVLGLRAFLIGRLAIRKCASGEWELANGGNTALRRFRLFNPTIATAAIA